MSSAHKCELLASSPAMRTRVPIHAHTHIHIVPTKTNQSLPEPDPIIRVSGNLPLSTTQLGDSQEARAET